MESTRERTAERKKPHCLKRISSAITRGLETAFFRVGYFVGEYPILTIVLTLVICGLCGIGLKTFHETDSQVKLWVPQDSRITIEKEWVDKTFPTTTRFLSIIAESSTNVLTPEFLKALMNYYTRSVWITVSGLKFNNFCVRVGGKCRATSLLELWDYDYSVINQLTRADIVDKVNNVSVSPSFGYEITTLLGGNIIRSRSSSRKIVAATATQLTWVTTGMTQVVKEWESTMIQIARMGHPKISFTYVYASRSFDDEGYGAVNDDISLLTAGFSIVFFFVMLSLGKFNLMEQKIYVSLAGMMCVGLSLLFAYGLATAMDLIYSPIQSIMPFMLLGIGVDDMFVVIEAWKNLSPEENVLSVPNKMATTLKQAGVSITVTSITDAVAFGVGASTVIPALSAFCLYAVFGIFALFVLVSTFFSACISLDERRRRANLDACILCYKHTDYMPNKCSQGWSILQVFFGKVYGPNLLRLPVKIAVILVTLVFFAVNVWSFTLLKQELKLSTYIPSDSYAYQYFEAKERLFNTQGVDTAVYCGGFSYHAHWSQLEAMHQEIVYDPYVQNGTVNAWFINYHAWLNQTGQTVTTESGYVGNLTIFLSTVGTSLANFVKFDNDANPTAIIERELFLSVTKWRHLSPTRSQLFSEGHVAIKLDPGGRMESAASYITLRHLRQPDSSSDIRAMDSLRAIVDGAGLPQYEDNDLLPTHKCFAYSQSYLTYETNKVLLEELYRNLALAGVSVLVVTCVLIADLRTSFLVFSCVIFTVVDVAGVLQFWGTSIDTASGILLTLTVGLAVDYSAHIGHTFMTISGPRHERTLVTLRNIGPAVFNGGFSTFLAFVLLANSSSYGFVVFFRVFSTVVLFGLFHGLAFLPVVLSIVGPPAYLHADIIPKSRHMTFQPDQPKTEETTSVEVASVNGVRSGRETSVQHIELQQISGHDPSIQQEHWQSSPNRAYHAPFTVSDSLDYGIHAAPHNNVIFLQPRRPRHTSAIQVHHGLYRSATGLE